MQAMTTLYDRVASLPGGGRALASARLRGTVLDILHAALRSSKLTQVDLATRLRVRKSAVNRVFQGDGNVQIKTVAEYLYELGAELRIEAVPFGTQRQEAVTQLERQHTAIMGMFRLTVKLAMQARTVETPADIQWRTGIEYSVPQALADVA
jgi:transcriptional regulator with XRE-family HTH domain